MATGWNTPLLLLLLSVVAITRAEEDNYPGIGPCNSMYNKPCEGPNIHFFLYTGRDPEQAEELSVEEGGNLTESSFDPRLPTKVVIHGYNSNKDLVYLVDIRRGYLSAGEYNVIAVDWSMFSNGPWFCYPMVVDNSNHAGRCVALLVEAARSSGAQDLHLIGFSVGAHVAGLTANHLSHYTIPRISGLDPAMPLFATRGPEGRLDASDARFVDVVHSNALVQGMVQECGHSDFYMNGGLMQPGCSSEHNVMACNHHRAPAYFAESITSDNGFWGWRCRGLFYYALGLCSPKPPAVIMGANATPDSRGFHVVMTAAESPYALGEWTR